MLEQLVTTALDDDMMVAFARTSATLARTPEFPMPASLTAYGLPSVRLGLVTPSFGVESSLLVFRGGFGAR